MFTIWIAALTLVAQTTPTAPPTVRLMSYDETVRCAGLTQAASELEGGESTEGHALVDAALYWSLSAGQAASVAGRSTLAADADQTRARLTAVRQLTGRNAEAQIGLQRCRERTPHLG